MFQVSPDFNTGHDFKVCIYFSVISFFLVENKLSFRSIRLIVFL